MTNMLEKFLDQTKFTSQEDFKKNFHVKVPENFNFGYDVVDAWAEEAPDKIALCWTNDHGVHHDFTFSEINEYICIMETRISMLSSVEQSSTNTISMFSYVCSKRLRKQRSNLTPAL